RDLLVVEWADFLPLGADIAKKLCPCAAAHAAWCGHQRSQWQPESLGWVTSQTRQIPSHRRVEKFLRASGVQATETTARPGNRLGRAPHTAEDILVWPPRESADRRIALASPGVRHKECAPFPGSPRTPARGRRVSY